MNLAILKGNLGGHPELKHKGETAYCRFSVATGRRVKRGDDWETETTWHRCTAFNRTAEMVDKHFRKGDMILVRGRIENRKYEDRNGETKYATGVIVDEVEFCQPKQDRQSDRSRDDYGSSGRQEYDPKKDPRSAEFDDDIPF